MRPFSEILQQAQAHSLALTKVQDEAVFYFVQQNGDHVYTFVSTLDVKRGEVEIVYEVTKDNYPVHTLKELPTEIMASYGMFIANVEEWKNGGELAAHLRPESL